MIRKLIIAFSIMMLGATGVQATELAISFNDSSAQVAVRGQVGSYDSGRSIFNVRGLFNDDLETSLFSSSLDMMGPVGNSGLEIGAGIIGYYAESQAARSTVTDDIAGVGIGAIIGFTPAGLEKLSFGGRVYYCPKIFTGLDGENILEIEARVAFEIAPNAKVFAYYNEIEADIENKNNRTLDDSLRVGLSIGF